MAGAGRCVAAASRGEQQQQSRSTARQECSLAPPTNSRSARPRWLRVSEVSEGPAAAAAPSIAQRVDDGAWADQPGSVRGPWLSAAVLRRYGRQRAPHYRFAPVRAGGAVLRWALPYTSRRSLWINRYSDVALQPTQFWRYVG
jgi:hypothetical protein